MPATLRVLMIGWEFPPVNSGGLGVACQGIVENLVESGCELVLVLPKRNFDIGKTTTKFKTKNGLEYSVIFVTSNLTPYDNFSMKSGVTIYDACEDYAKLITRSVQFLDFDVIHIHDWMTVLAGIELKNFFRKPLIMHVHSTELDRTAMNSGNPVISEIEKMGLESADKIIAVSGYTKNLLTSRFEVPSDKVSVVFNGVDPIDKNSLDNNFLGFSKVVLFVGRLTIQKGAEFFLKVAVKVIAKVPDAVFVLAGDGDMFQYLIEQSAFQSLTGSVLFAGFLRDKTKERLFSRADVFVMPSVSEPFGIVALEAAVVGVPVIISKTSGAAEVLNSAIKVDFWDVDLTAKKIIEIISNDEYKRKLGELVKSEAERYTWQSSAQNIGNVYRKLLKS